MDHTPEVAHPRRGARFIGAMNHSNDPGLAAASGKRLGLNDARAAQQLHGLSGLIGVGYRHPARDDDAVPHEQFASLVFKQFHRGPFHFYTK